MKAQPDVAVPLDQLLTQAATGPTRRLLPGSSGFRFLRSLSKNPAVVTTHASVLARELVRVAAGTSETVPARGDRRFVDGAWTSNPLLKRTMQAYLATSTSVEGIVRDTPLEWKDAQRMQFVTSNVVEALSPSNSPFLSPLGWKAVIDSGGTSLLTGTRNLIRDMSSTPRIPTMVEPSAYRVGKDLAISPGAVVHRAEMFEIIHYTPATEKVRQIPLLIIPPTINKYYVLDLAPGRSLVEYLVGEGQQVFMLSWRNPDARHRDWGIDAYAEAMLEASNVVAKIAGTETTHVMAACSGGIIASLTAAHRAAAGERSRLASLTLLVTMIDQKQSGTVSALTNRAAARAALARSRRKGYLDGRTLAEVFAWLRPNDLIWNYWVNNYVEGKIPPKFDILFWNADTTRMTAALHRDFVEAAMNDSFTKAGAVEVLGTPIDLSTVTADTYVVAGSADHICPWVNCYRSAQLLSGKTRFVLSTNGHIAALVNPPSNPKSSFRVLDDTSLEASDWKETATKESGSWWPDYVSWLRDRSGDEKPAPSTLGSDEFPPREKAPGTYVFER